MVVDTLIPGLLNAASIELTSCPGTLEYLRTVHAGKNKPRRAGLYNLAQQELALYPGLYALLPKLKCAPRGATRAAITDIGPYWLNTATLLEKIGADCK